MKRILLLVIGAMISLPVGARTLYVDASRPNNNGNGLKTTTAKKTIQAAVNAARAGDTIIVLGGTYAPITTKNKKITIKAKSGAARTKILYSGTKKANSAVVKLGKTWTKRTAYPDGNGNVKYVTESSGGETKGTSTKVSGFTIDGTKRGVDKWDNIFGVSGGTLKSCIVQNVSGNRTVCRANLTDCTLRDNGYLLIERSSLSRCKIQSNTGNSKYGKSASSTFANCLLAGNDTVPIKGCTFANCTVAENTAFTMSSSKAWNTIFHGVASSQFASKKKNTLTKCYKGKNPMFNHLEEEVWVTNTTTNWQYDPSGPDTIYTNGVEYLYATNHIETTTNYTARLDEPQDYDPNNPSCLPYYDGVQSTATVISYTLVETVLLDNGDDYTTTTNRSDNVGQIKTFSLLSDGNLYYWLDEANDYCCNLVVTDICQETVTKKDVSLPARGRWVTTTTQELADEIPGDYHLKKGSPCINKGTKTAAAKKLFGTKDLDKGKRIKGSTVDIGCYEY